MAEGACGYKSGPTLGIQPTPSHHSKCKSPLCVKSCALSEFGISKEAWCFDSNFGIKHNYENRPLCPEGTYFLRKEETQRSCVCVWLNVPTCLLHITSEFISIFIIVSVLFSLCQYFFHWVSDEDGGPSQQIIRVRAGMCPLSGPQSWKHGRNERYGQLGTVETWDEICFWSNARPVTHSQNTARKSHLNHHANSHTCTHAVTRVKTTKQMHLMYALSAQKHTLITRGCLDHPRWPVNLISPLPA